MAETTRTDESGAAGAPRNFDLLLDVPLDVTVEIGRARVAIRELLQLTPGSVVELTKPAGESLDVLINGKPVARGEAVLVNDRFAVRLIDIISPSERIAGLR